MYVLLFSLLISLCSHPSSFFFFAKAQCDIPDRSDGKESQA
jgi:hypothetical protein